MVCYLLQQSGFANLAGPRDENGAEHPGQHSQSGIRMPFHVHGTPHFRQL
jgi:hypothetical protein